MLKIENATKYYGDILGIEDINLQIDDGIIFGFIGPNGAGKSTTIKCILNFLDLDEGNITFDSKEIDNKTKEIIGYLPAEVELYEDMYVKDMVKYAMSFYKKDCTKKATSLIKKFKLDIDKKISELSLGNLKKLGLVLTLMHSPKLIILDEPTSGLDPLMQEVFFDVMREEKKNGNTIFFSSHNLNEVKKICDRIAIIRKGKIVKEDSIENIIRDNFMIVNIWADDIKKAHLPLKSMKIKEMKNDFISCIYEGDINILIASLKEIKITKLNIQEPTLEEVFMHYYKEV